MWIGDDTEQRRRYRLSIDRYTLKGHETLARAFTISGRQQAFLYYGPLASPRGLAKIVIYTPGHKRIRTLPIR